METSGDPSKSPTSEFPKIISVDDHVLEPPNVWQDRLPKKYLDIGPRVERLPVKRLDLDGGTARFFPGQKGDEGDLADWWRYEDLCKAMTRQNGASGHPREDLTRTAVTYDWYRPGCYQVKERLEDMDQNWTEASLCFGNIIRFCGQTFLEAKDRELALLCVKAYNDWMIEEWCADSGGRLIPLTIIPLWDPHLAADEVRRNAARGCHAVCFSENPAELNLPSMHDPDQYWDPFFAACEETETVINMHIGSASKLHTTSKDAPAAVFVVLDFCGTAEALTDWLTCGAFVRFPDLKIALSEGQIGWIPYVLERADNVFHENLAWTGIEDTLPVPPSELYRGRVYGCMFADEAGLRLIDKVGEDQVTFEIDYPHAASTWPNSRKILERQTRHLTDEQVYKVTRGNAIRMLSLDFDADRPTVLAAAGGS